MLTSTTKLFRSLRPSFLPCISGFFNSSYYTPVRFLAEKTDFRPRLEKLKTDTLLGGGEKRIAAQFKKGKLTARQRIELLTDKNSFTEIDPFILGINSKYPGDGVVSGHGLINGRQVAVYSQDFTVLGGSLGNKTGYKIARCMELAGKMGIPIIGLLDGGGARIQEGVSSLAGYGDIFYNNTGLSGVVPQISLVMGPCAGGAVYSPAITDFIFMTANTGHMFITGPEVVKAACNEDVTQEELGGASAHTIKSGVCAGSFNNDIEALSSLRTFLDFLPLNNTESAPRRLLPSSISKSRLSPDPVLENIVPADPNKSYNVIDIIDRLIDPDEKFFEIFPNYARNVCIGFGRMNGHVVGFIANQPQVSAGVLDIDASDKAARFIRFLDCFNIPIITLIDVPGFLPGTNQEHNGIIRHGAKMIYAYSEATVPKISVILRKAYGGAYIVMSSKHLGGDVNYAWPSAEIAVMGADGAVKILYRKKEDQAKEKENYIYKYSNPLQAANLGYIDDIIYPSMTRMRIIQDIEYLQRKKHVSRFPKRKHGSIPL